MTADPSTKATRGVRIRGLLVWLPAAAWMAVIFRFSAMPGSNVPGDYGTLAHFVEFAVLGALLFLPLHRRDRHLTRAVATTLVIASLYGASDEFHQAFVPGRVPDIADWAVDTAGAALAALTLGIALARKRKTAREGRPS